MNKFSEEPWGRRLEPVSGEWFVEDGRGNIIADGLSEQDSLLMTLAPEMYALLDELAAHDCRWACSDDWCRALLPRLHALVNLVANHETRNSDV